MLALFREPGQEITIDGGIVVRVLAVDSGRVKLGLNATSISAPRNGGLAEKTRRDAKLAEVRGQIGSHHAAWVDRGGKMTHYWCQHCGGRIETPRPGQKDVGPKGYWDAVRDCYECGRNNMVVTFPNGTTVVS